MLIWVAFGFLISLSLVIASFGLTFSALGADKSSMGENTARTIRNEDVQLMPNSLVLKRHSRSFSSLFPKE